MVSFSEVTSSKKRLVQSALWMSDLRIVRIIPHRLWSSSSLKNSHLSSDIKMPFKIGGLENFA